MLNKINAKGVTFTSNQKTDAINFYYLFLKFLKSFYLDEYKLSAIT